MTDAARPGREGAAPTRTRRAALGGLLLLAAAHYGWNAAAQPGFWGYDEGAHAAYALSILEGGGLPHPLSGWSSFHPPLYHALAAGLWRVLEPLGPAAVLIGLRLLSALGVLAAAAVVHALVRRAGSSEALALAAAALVLFVPVAQLAGSMIGNEALAAGLAALALLQLDSLQRDPRRPGAAAGAGLFAGLAWATKFSGAWVVAACAVPFLRRDLGPRGRWAALLCLGVAVGVAAPVYVRNAALTGTPLPMTRTLDPMKRQEASLMVQPRRWTDYVVVPAACGRYPYVAVVVEGGVWAGLNPAMQSVPCLTYAGVWFDPFGLRATRLDPREGLGWGRWLLYAGLAPTLLVVLGLARGLGRAWASRGRDPGAPLVVVAALAGLGYGVFSWLAPSLGAAKASYLLPALAPAGVFFASGAALLGPRVRAAALVASLAAAALAAWTFTTGAVFAAADPQISRGFWLRVGAELPDSYIRETVVRLLP
jgi:hypothetical protein